MIKNLDWDSAMFGYAVGQIDIKSDAELAEKNFVKAARDFTLVYIVSDKKLSPMHDKIALVDTKIRLSKDVKETAGEPLIDIHEYDGGNNEQLQKLAFQSGIYSRFNRDSKFSRNEFSKLYTKWIDDSIQKKIADVVLVCQQNKNYNGLVTLAYKDGFSEIGLLAVDENSRGKGIGLALLQQVNQCTAGKGLKKIEVTTQYENLPAMQLYIKAGYDIVSTKYIYHFWC